MFSMKKSFELLHIIHPAKPYLRNFYIAFFRLILQYVHYPIAIKEKIYKMYNILDYIGFTKQRNLANQVIKFK